MARARSSLLVKEDAEGAAAVAALTSGPSNQECRRDQQANGNQGPRSSNPSCHQSSRNAQPRSHPLLIAACYTRCPISFAYGRLPQLALISNISRPIFSDAADLRHRRGLRLLIEDVPLGLRFMLLSAYPVVHRHKGGALPAVGRHGDTGLYSIGRCHPVIEDGVANVSNDRVARHFRERGVRIQLKREDEVGHGSAIVSPYRAGSGPPGFGGMSSFSQGSALFAREGMCGYQLAE